MSQGSNLTTGQLDIVDNLTTGQVDNFIGSQRPFDFQTFSIRASRDEDSLVLLLLYNFYCLFKKSSTLFRSEQMSINYFLNTKAVTFQFPKG